MNIADAGPEPKADFSLTDLLYGEPLDGQRGVARPFVAGLVVLDCMDATRGDDGVWVVRVEDCE